MFFRSAAVACLLVVLSGAALSCTESVEVTTGRATRFGSTVVGATGATVAGPEGASVVVPPGALAHDVTIEVSSLEGLRLPAGARAVGPAMRLGPADTVLLEALTISVPISPAMLNGRSIEDVVLIRWDPESDSFLPLSTQLSAGGTAVVATTDRFSDFVPVVLETSAGNVCGNGTCESSAGNAETCASCSIDCGDCPSDGCGDSMTIVSEACDDGNILSNDGCNSTCTMIEPGFTCAFGYVCYVGACGDGLVQSAETCDDGNTDGGDGCSAECFVMELGYVCPTPGAPCTMFP